MAVVARTLPLSSRGVRESGGRPLPARQPQLWLVRAPALQGRWKCLPCCTFSPPLSSSLSRNGASPVVDSWRRRARSLKWEQKDPLITPGPQCSECGPRLPAESVQAENRPRKGQGPPPVRSPPCSSSPASVVQGLLLSVRRLGLSSYFCFDFYFDINVITFNVLRFDICISYFCPSHYFQIDTLI